MWGIFASSDFDYEIRNELVGIFDSEEKAKEQKEQILKNASKEIKEEMIYYIEKIEVNKILESAKYLI